MEIKSEQNKISIPINVTFVSRDYISATNLQVEKGSLMSESDFTNQRPVILLTAEDARKLTSNIVGHEIIAQDFRGTKATLTVIGILKPNTSKTAILPYGAIAIDSPLRTLKFAVNDIKVMPSAIELLSVFTQKTWGDHVTITTISDNKISKLISIVVFAFASTTLLVASLNIMNLMLARVLRHTQDIGIRRVLGASQLNIMYWFLAESLVLGILGGLLGILISYGFVNIFLSNVIGFDGTSGNSSLFTWHSVLVGIIIAVITSFLIGFYPSLRASRLPIIQSLKDTM